MDLYGTKERARKLLDDMEREMPERVGLATIRVFGMVRLHTDQNELYADY